MGREKYKILENKAPTADIFKMHSQADYKVFCCAAIRPAKIKTVAFEQLQEVNAIRAKSG